MRRALVIVGAGFSGSVVAVNLLRQPHALPTDVYLVERGADMGRGVAYAQSRYPHLLNVPAGRLSADAEDPQQFLRYVRATLPDAGAEDFLPRSLYGDYLKDLLERSERQPADNVRLQRVRDEVLAVERTADQGMSVRFSRREPIVASAVVLASGNPPASLLPWTESLRGHPALRENPWDLPADVGADHCVVIIGNGLTMADVAVALSADRACTPTMHTVSRRGLLPRAQTEFRHLTLEEHTESLLSRTHSARGLTRAARELAREVERAGGDWREAVTFMRSLAPLIWRRMPHAERSRFVRHVQAHWDVHRHRLPPQVAEHLQHLRSVGKLKVNAGRVQAAMPQGNRVRVSWMPRGNGPLQSVVADYIVNASGPDYALERSREPLIRALRTQGMISADALNLGISTGAFGACLDAHGKPSSSLYYVGPMLRADHWEATAAAELRDHARRLAEHLARSP